jgi:hypothetical protein
LLVGCLGIGWLAGLRGVGLIVASLLVSGVLSWFLLRRQRIGMGVAVEQTVARSRARLAERTAREDAYVDALLDRPDPPPSTGDGSPRAEASEPGPTAPVPGGRTRGRP